jgi:hypothetical protein
MNIPSVQERQKYWKWAYASVCFENVVEACSFIFKPPQPLPKAIRRIMVTGIVATYARPFTQSHSANKIPEDIVPKKHLSLHKGKMDTRHKEAAHVEARNYEADDPGFGNIDQVRITITKGQLGFYVLSTEPPFPELKQL